MNHLKRRTVTACAIVAALLLTAAVCVYIRRDAPRAMRAESTTVMAEQGDPVLRFRTEREELRSRHIAELNEIIHSDTADGDIVNIAQRQLMDLMKASETEQKLEGLLQMRGFSDALATVSDSSVNVILRNDAPTRQENAVILDLILRETGVTAGNVKILSINQ